MSTNLDLRAPEVAWPTLGLLAVVVGGYVGVVALNLGGALPLWAAVPLLVWLAYASFTPMHDSAHLAVARARWVNGLTGRLAALPLCAPYPAFRYVHLEHHKHTNDPEQDPDFWSGRGPWPLLPLRWLTQDLHYYALIVLRWRQRPAAELVETVLTFLAVVGVLGGLAWLGYGWEVLWLALVPSRLAIGLLAWSFDYLPHRPHQILAKDDRFRATHVVGERWLSPFFLCQNYHLVHHLYPGLPWYRYSRGWYPQREQLLARGAQILWGARNAKTPAQSSGVGEGVREGERALAN